MWIGHRKEIRARNRSDEGLTLKTSASEFLYGGQLTKEQVNAVKTAGQGNHCEVAFPHMYIQRSVKI